MFLRRKYAVMRDFSRQLTDQPTAKFAASVPMAVAYFARPATSAKPAAGEMIHVD
jgi:hypothetical protein